MDTRRKYMGIVMFSALVVAFESVGVEAAINTFGIGSFVVSAVPSIVAGLALVAAMPSRSGRVARDLGRRGWMFMLATSVFIALGVLLWFDAVGRIGASKEAILGGGSSEVLFIVLLSAAFLGERLSRRETSGSVLILLGVFMVLANAETLSLDIGLGEAEAIISSFLLAVSVVMTAVLLRSHGLVPVSGIEMLLSGALLLAMGAPFGLLSWPDAAGLLVLLGLGCFPAVGILTYYAGLPKIGASLTSVLFALVGIMTVGVQLLVLAAVPGAEMILPRSLPLALMGGLVAFAGVYLLNTGEPTGRHAA
ncbi:MAG: DMT family transporter [Candidatus Thermoplasmatota archaeon]